MVADQARPALAAALNQAIGEEASGTLMELVPPIDWSEIATRSDVAGLLLTALRYT